MYIYSLFNSYSITLFIFYFIIQRNGLAFEMSFSFAKSLKNKFSLKNLYDHNFGKFAVFVCYFERRFEEDCRYASCKSRSIREVSVSIECTLLQPSAATHKSERVSDLGKGLPVWKSKDARCRPRAFRARIACGGARNTWKKRNARHALSPHPCHFDGGHPVS